MLQLLDELLAPASDRRGDRRFQTTFGTVCYLDRTPTKPVSGLVWDISTSGVGLLLPFAPMRGKVFPLLLTTENGRAAISVSIEVAHVRQLSTGDYFVGSRFDRTLTANELKPFLLPEDGCSLTSVEAAPSRSVRKAVPQANSSWVNRRR